VREAGGRGAKARRERYQFSSATLILCMLESVLRFAFSCSKSNTSCRSVLITSAPTLDFSTS